MQPPGQPELPAEPRQGSIGAKEGLLHGILGRAAVVEPAHGVHEQGCVVEPNDLWKRVDVASAMSLDQVTLIELHQSQEGSPPAEDRELETSANDPGGRLPRGPSAAGDLILVGAAFVDLSRSTHRSRKHYPSDLEEELVRAPRDRDGGGVTESDLAEAAVQQLGEDALPDADAGRGDTDEPDERGALQRAGEEERVARPDVRQEPDGEQHERCAADRDAGGV